MKQIIILLILISVVDVHGEGLTFSHARELMYNNNREIKVAREAVEIAQMELRATRGLRFPVLNLTSGYILMQRDIDVDLGGRKGAINNMAQSIIKDGITTGILTPNIAELINAGISPLLAADWSFTLQKRSTLIGGISLTQPIYMGGKINAAIRACEIRLHQAEHQLQAIENSKLSELVELYYGVIVAQMAHNLRITAVNGISSHLSDTRALEEEGMIAHSEVLYVEYKLAEAKREKDASENQLRIARSALSRLINCDNDAELVDRLFIVETLQPIDYYKEKAISINPILLSAKEDISLSIQGEKVAQSELLPEVAALGTTTIFSHNLSTMVPRWSVGIGVNLKLFDGLGKERRYVAAQKMTEMVRSIVNDAEQGVILLVDREYYNAINSLNTITTLDRSIEFAASYLQAKKDGFTEGITPSAEVIDAQLQLEAAHLERCNTAYSFCKSLARLLEVSGLSNRFDEYRNIAIFI